MLCTYSQQEIVKNSWGGSGYIFRVKVVLLEKKDYGTFYTVLQQTYSKIKIKNLCISILALYSLGFITLLAKFWRISLCATDEAICKALCDETFSQIEENSVKKIVTLASSQNLSYNVDE